MARLIEVLKKRDGMNGSASAPAEPAESAGAVCACASEEAFPYIEIDGATRTLAGSPDVLQTPIQLPRPSPVTTAPAAILAPATDTATPTAFGFQPWSNALNGAAYRLAPELVVWHQPRSAASEPYFQLLEQLLRGERPPQVLLFVAATPVTSLTATILNLAAAACHGSQREAVVLDGQRQGPSVAELLDLPALPGLAQVLTGKIAIQQALHPSPLPNLSLLNLTGGRAADAACVNHDALRWVLNWLRQRFALIFVNAGMWQGTPEHACLASLCDGVFPVVHNAAGDSAAESTLIRSLLEHGGPVRGVINVRV